MSETRYPLCWPAGVPRAKYAQSNSNWKQDSDRIRADLLEELERMKVDDVIISTNARTNAFGVPRMDERPRDAGVAIYFTRKGKRLCFACDRWDSIRLNMKAICMTIEAIRGLERWGASDMVERAFTGFAALPARASRPWREVLHFTGPLQPSNRDAIEQRFRELAKQHHPDKPGGDHAAMAELNAARDQALREVS
jgi:hypothetical protein